MPTRHPASRLPGPPRDPARFAGWAVVAVLGIVIAGFVIAGIWFAGSRALPTANAAASQAATATAAASPQAEASAAPSSAATPSAQPTASVSIRSAANIVRRLTVQVTSIDAVTGIAKAPGEIGGPSVRFTVAITNDTGRAVDLTHTVVNAYSGSAASPAVELGLPGGRAFPASVAAGGRATGVFVFNIPVAERGDVTLTVDTATNHPVVAFTGNTPK